MTDMCPPPRAYNVRTWTPKLKGIMVMPSMVSWPSHPSERMETRCARPSRFLHPGGLSGWIKGLGVCGVRSVEGGVGEHTHTYTLLLLLRAAKPRRSSVLTHARTGEGAVYNRNTHTHTRIYTLLHTSPHARTHRRGRG